MKSLSFRKKSVVDQVVIGDDQKHNVDIDQIKEKASNPYVQESVVSFKFQQICWK